MIRLEADAPISTTRWCELLGIPRATWYRWKAAHERAGSPGGWPAPVVDAIEADVAAAAKRHDAWGHRKIWGVLRLQDHPLGPSPSSVKRAMARRGLLQPVGYQGERRQLAKARKAAFVDPPGRRNRVWQMDFSELESAAGGIWRLGGVVDYYAKVCLAATTQPTQTAGDAIAALERAREQAEAWLGHPLADEVVDPDTGEIVAQITVVTDNGPAFRSVRFARWIDRQPEFAHVRTRHRAPHTNGVIERTFQSFKYEHLYRHDIDDGLVLAAETEACRETFNTVRPHEHLDFQTPISIYLQQPMTDIAEPSDPQPKIEESVSKT